MTEFLAAMGGGISGAVIGISFISISRRVIRELAYRSAYDKKGSPKPGKSRLWRWWLDGQVNEPLHRIANSLENAVSRFDSREQLRDMELRHQMSESLMDSKKPKACCQISRLFALRNGLLASRRHRLRDQS